MPPTHQHSGSNPHLEVGHWSDPGRQRRENEDCYGVATGQASDLLAQRGYWRVEPEQRLAERGYLFVVTDGVGGHNAGAIASELATQVILRDYYQASLAEPRTALTRAISMANQAILVRSSSGGPAFAEMGTTVVAAVLRGDEATVAHVGDSRCYLVNQAGVQQLTQDHTWVRDQIQAGVLTEEEAQNHTYRHVLSRTVGRSDAGPDVITLKLQAGDLLLLCSDGLSNLVAPHEIQAIVLRYAPQAAVEQLIALANERGGPDNITVVIVQVHLATADSGPIADLSTWMASVPRPWLAAGIVGFAAVVCLVLFTVNGLLSPVQRPTSTPTKTSAAAVVVTPVPEAPATVASIDTPAPGPVATMAPASTPEAPTTVVPASENLSTVESPSTTPLPAPTPTPIIYIVVADDSISKLAQKFGITVDDIKTANDIKDENLIYIGQRLIIPVPQ